jgi:hypothetical protein
MVLPYLSASASAALSGKSLAIELHDTYKDSAGSLAADKDRDFANTLVFSRDRAHMFPVLIPDPFQMTNFGGAIDRLDDTTPWKEKAPKMFFAGTTTGNRDPTKNERIQRCVWSLDHRDIADFYITHVAQMDARDALKAVPKLSQVIHQRFSEDHHIGYRLAANIAGNTCSWSRIPSIMKTRSVLFDFTHEDIQWYTPAMVDGVHYVSVDSTNLAQKYASFVNDEAKCAAMSDNANVFVQAYTRSLHAAQYMKHLLESAVYHNAA